MGKQREDKSKAFLSDLWPDEISVVPRGGNQKKIFLKKVNGGNNMTNEELILLKEKIDNAKDMKEVAEAIEKAELSDDDKKTIKGAMKLLSSVQDVPKSLMQQLSAMAGYGYPEPEKKQGDKEDKEKMKKELNELVKEVSALVKEDSFDKFNELLESNKLDKVEKATKEDNPEVVKLMKERKEQEERILKMEKQILRKEYEEKAKEFKNLNIKKEQFTDILMKVEIGEKLSDDERKGFSEMLKAADKQLDENNTLLKELGNDNNEPSDAEVKLEKEADKLMKANTKLSKEAAIVEVLESNPKLYDEYNSK